MFIGISNAISGIRSAGLSYIKDNLKLYLDFKSNRSDELKFPCEGSTLFDGTDDYIDCGSDSTLDQVFVGGGTLTAWIKPSSDGENNYGRIFDKSTATSGADGFYFLVTDESSGNCELRFAHGFDSTVGFWDSTATVALNTWNHVAVVYDNSSTSNDPIFYINGVSVTVTEGDTPAGTVANDSSQTLFIGNNTGNARTFDGSIANAGIWSRALSAEEVNSVMRKNYSQLGSVEKTSLVSWWALDSLEGNGVLDLATTEVLGSSLITGDNSDMDTVGNWASGSSDFNVSSVSGGNPGNCLKVLNVKGSPATNFGAYLGHSALTSGRLYKLTFDVKNDGVMTENLKFFSAGTEMKDEIPTTSSWVTQTIYFIADSTANYLTINVDSAIQDGEYYMLDNVFLQGVSSGNHGVPSGTTTTTSVYGGNAPVLPRAVDVAREGEAEAIGNGSALFDGTDDYIQIADSNVLDAPASWTLSAWIKIGASTSGFDRIIGKQTTADQCNYGIGLANGTDFGVFIADTNGGFDDLYYATNLTVGEWYHGVGTWDGTYLKVYLNGILVSTSSDLSSANESVANTAPVLIGRNATDGDQYFKGNLSQVGIWQGALTQAQIQSVMESTSYAKIPASVKSTLGSEKFGTADNDWTVSGSYVSISDGVLSYTGSGSDNDNFTYAGSTFGSFAFATGKLYKLVVTIANTTTARFKVQTTSHTVIYGSANYSVGTHTIYLNGTSSINGQGIVIRGESSQSNFDITEYSLKEVTNELVGYWALDADSGNSTSGKALSFDGDNDYVEISDSDALDQGTNDFTVSFWHKSDAQHDQPMLNKKATFSDSSAGWTIYMENGANQMRCRIGGGSSNVAVSAGTVAVNDDKWHLTTMVRSGDNLYLYADGSQEGSTTGVNNLNVDNSEPLYIARSASLYPACEIAQVAIYDTALTTAQILTQFKNGSNADWSSDANLVGYWKLNNASTVTDLSSNSNNGTVNGATLIDNVSVYDSTDNNNNGDLY